MTNKTPMEWMIEQLPDDVKSAMAQKLEVAKDMDSFCKRTGLTADYYLISKNYNEGLKKVFEEAVKNRPTFTHKDSRYTIDNGCKIEIYDDGKVKIYNTRTGGDFYEHVSPYYYKMFEELGFDIGSMQLSVDTLGIALKKIESRTEKKFEIERKNLKEKIDDYKDKIAILKKRNHRGSTDEA